MSDRLPALTAKKLAGILAKLGFKPIRQRGSHVFFRHDDGRTTVVPFHGNEDIDRSLLRQIIRETGLSPEEFSKHL
ncbi:MAG: type II toxin-antitoxin system HicA family toxin [Patescibacteria group bacterium]